MSFPAPRSSFLDIFRPAPSNHRLSELWEENWVQQPGPGLHYHYDGPTYGLRGFSTSYQVFDFPTSPRPHRKDHIIKGILIRDEYVAALSAVIAFSNGSTAEFPLEPSVSGTFQNPFEIESNTKSLQGAFLVHGNPGIGRTIFLHFVLALRLRARLPTLIQYDDNKCYLFQDDGVFICDTKQKDIECLQDHVPLSTWILVDGNKDLKTVPTYLQDLARFIIQAISPQKEQIEWIDKLVGLRLTYYWMKPWTLRELLIGASLQLKHQTSDNIVSFFRDFGPSARHVYEYSNSRDLFEISFDSKISGLSYSAIENVLHRALTSDFSHEASHHIFLLGPGRSRTRCCVTFPTTFVASRIQHRLDKLGSLNTAKIYKLFLQHPYTIGTAGYILDSRIHPILSVGRSWVLSQLGKDKPGPTNWVMDILPNANATKLYVGYNEHAALLDISPDLIQIPPTNLPMKLYLPNTTITPSSGYYLPAYRSEETFDAFIYDSGRNGLCLAGYCFKDPHLQIWGCRISEKP